MPEGMRPPKGEREFSWCGAALSGDFLSSLLFFLDHRLKAMQEAHAKGLVLTEDGAAGPIRNEKKMRGCDRAWVGARSSERGAPGRPVNHAMGLMPVGPRLRARLAKARPEACGLNTCQSGST